LDQVKQAIDAFLAQVRQAMSQVLNALKAQIDQILAGVKDLLDKLDHLLVDDLFHRLLNVLSNLETSFNQQLDRVRNEFDSMLNAIPLNGSAAVTA
jgi:ABC-type transporter Mla subunit MlaD